MTDDDTQSSLEKIKKRLANASTSCIMEGSLLKRSETVSPILLTQPESKFLFLVSSFIVPNETALSFQLTIMLSRYPVHSENDFRVQESS